jgi:cytochrome c oxidase cbb3-type subunit 1
MHPFYVMRWAGGMFFLTGMLIMAYNVLRTVTGPVTEKVNDAVLVPHAAAH